MLRLIGHYQAGQDPTPELAFKPGPLPKFDGNLGTGGVPLPPPGPPPGQLRPQVSGGPIRVPPLTPEKVNQYSALFEKSGAQDGILPGEHEVGPRQDLTVKKKKNSLCFRSFVGTWKACHTATTALEFDS